MTTSTESRNVWKTFIGQKKEQCFTWRERDLILYFKTDYWHHSLTNKSLSQGVASWHLCRLNRSKVEWMGWVKGRGLIFTDSSSGGRGCCLIRWEDIKKWEGPSAISLPWQQEGGASSSLSCSICWISWSSCMSTLTSDVYRSWERDAFTTKEGKKEEIESRWDTKFN